MNKDKWLNIIDMVEANFGIQKEEKNELNNAPGEKHIIEFNGPLGVIRLEFTQKAKLQDEKTIYSNRVGSEVVVNKEYSQDETVCFLNAYKWNSTTDEWDEINLANLNL